MSYHVFFPPLVFFGRHRHAQKGGEYENEQPRHAEKLITELLFGCTTNIAMVINYYAKE
jgi:hypothetical protein